MYIYIYIYIIKFIFFKTLLKNLSHLSDDGKCTYSMNVYQGTVSCHSSLTSKAFTNFVE